MAAERNQNYYWKQASFAGGVYGSDMYGRDDLQRYGISAKTMLNFYPYPFGGFTRRLGTRFIHECKYSDRKCRLIPFIYSEKTAFILELGDHYIRVYRGEGIVVNGDTPVEIATPYEEQDIDKIKYIQSADRMYLCHTDYPVMTLSRYSDTDWRLEEYKPKRGPFREQNTSDITITPTPVENKPNKVQLTATGDVFKASMLGSLVQISYNVFGQTVETSSNGASKAIRCNGGWSFVMTDSGDGVIYVEQSNDNGATWKAIKSFNTNENGSPITDSGKVDHPCLLRINAGVTNGYRVALSADPYIDDGFVTITKVDNARLAYGEVYTDENDYVWGLADTSPTRYWALSAWSGEYGYPSAMSFYQDRLFFGGTDKDKLDIWASQTGNYDDFYSHQTPQDNDGVHFRLTSDSVNKPSAFLSMNSLLSFTAASTWAISSGSSLAAITPSSVSARQQSANGVSDIAPLIIGDRALFVSENGDRVRDMAYDYSTDTFKGTDQTLYNRDLFIGHKIIAWCSQETPDNIIWACRDDGKLLSFTYIFDQQVSSWSLHETKGSFESCACVPGEEQDEAYFVVKRTIGGQEKRYVEIMTHRTKELETMYYLDSCLYIQAKSEVNHLSGLEHLNGEKVGVVANGSYIGEMPVNNGELNLPYPASSIAVGLLYDSKFETVDIPIPRQDGSSFGGQKKISKIKLLLQDSYSGKVGINNFDFMETINMKRPQYVSGPSPMYNQIYTVEPMGSYEDTASITIEMDQPYPMTVLTIAAEVALNRNGY